MRLFLISASISILAATGACAAYDAGVEQTKSEESVTVDYTDAAGRVIGSVTKIGGVTYFAGPDGIPLGVAETVDGKRVYRRY